MDSGRTSACAFWLQTPASLNEAAQLSARVNQQANFGSDLFKQSTLDDCLENVPQQSRKKLEVSADDDYWNSSGQVGFSFEDDWDDSKRSGSFNELPPQPRNNLKHGATGKGTDLKLPSPSSTSVPLPSSPQSRRLDLGDIQKHAEKLRIGSQVGQGFVDNLCNWLALLCNWPASCGDWPMPRTHAVLASHGGRRSHGLSRR